MPPAKTCASGQRRDGYERRDPEQTLLYQVIAREWPSFRERAEFEGGLPEFIVDEFEAYLRCGILEHGVAQLACRRCGESMVVGFSCKKRGFCPSCLGRRMSLIPPPRFHMLRYHGVLAAHAKHRHEVVPGRDPAQRNAASLAFYQLAGRMS